MTYNRARDDESPCRGHWVTLDGSNHTQAVLCVLSLDGIRLHVGVASLLIGVVDILDLGLVALGLHFGIRVAHGEWSSN